MKNFILIAGILISPQLFAKCNTMAMGYYNQTGFGISFGGSGSKVGFFDKNTTNVPLTINGDQACYKKVSNFSMTSESKKNESEKNKIIITPLNVEFENIPNAHHRQFLYVEKNSNPLLRKFHTVSYICSGGVPLSIEATSDMVISLMGKSDDSSVSITHTFATGSAANNLKWMPTISMQESFDYFKNLYNQKTIKEHSVPDECCNDIKIPSILSHTSIHALSGVERIIASGFTTMGAEIPNGCSEDFIKTMGPYLLENFEKNESLESFKIKKKWFSNDLVFEW